MGKGNKNRKKQYFKANHKNQNKFRLNSLNFTPGMRGFICTSNSRFREAIKEARNILDEYYTKLHPEAVKEEESCGSIENDLANEVEMLKRKESPFGGADTGLKTCVFVRTTILNPVELAEAIVKDLHKTKTPKTKFLLRFIPIEISCKAYIDNIKSTADLLFDKYFKCEPTTFSVVVNQRLNNSVLKDEVIMSLSQIVWDKNREHKVDLNHSKKTVIVEIMKNVCGMSVINDYHEFKRYNLGKISRDDSQIKTDGENTNSLQEEDKEVDKQDVENTNLTEEESQDAKPQD